MDPEIWKTLLTVAASAVGAVLGVGLAFGRFRRERLWDARFKAYSDILAAVERVAAIGEYERASSCSEPTVMSNTDYLKGDTDARREIERHSQVSTLLLGRAFLQRLRILRRDLYHHDFQWNDELMGESDQVREEASLPQGAQAKALAESALEDLLPLAELHVGGGPLQFVRAFSARHRTRRSFKSS